MDLRRCDSGHLFDPMKHSACPFCGVPDLDMERTRPKRPADMAQALGVGQLQNQVIGARDAGKTVGVLRKKLGIDPVAGWLVCVKGPERGRDYRIRSERNFIGRSEKMDICIAGDESISREKHAVVTYDPKKNAFRFAPGESNSMVYLNGEDIETPTALQAYDRLQLGDTELLFVPFCGETFQWE